MEQKEIQHQNAPSIRGRTSTGPLRARIGWEIRNVWLSRPAVAPACVLHEGQNLSAKCCTGKITGVLRLRVSFWWSFSLASVPSWVFLEFSGRQVSFFCVGSYLLNKACLFYGMKKFHLFCDPSSSSTVWSFFSLMLSFVLSFSLPPLPRSSVACSALWLRVTLSCWPALYWSGSIWLYLPPSFTQLDLINKQILKMMKTGVVR